MSQDSNQLYEAIDGLRECILIQAHQLGNLLAVIHQDGGHYQQEVGTEAACKEAEHTVQGLRADVELRDDKIRRLEAERTKSRKANAKLRRAIRELALGRWTTFESYKAASKRLTDLVRRVEAVADYFSVACIQQDATPLEQEMKDLLSNIVKGGEGMSDERWHNWVDTADGRFIDEDEANAELDRTRAALDELMEEVSSIADDLHQKACVANWEYKVCAYIGKASTRLIKALDRAEREGGLTAYEDELPSGFTDEEYNQWYANSRVVDGVRMGPDVVNGRRK